jgi:hypothetical protein
MGAPGTGKTKLIDTIFKEYKKDYITLTMREFIDLMQGKISINQEKNQDLNNLQAGMLGKLHKFVLSGDLGCGIHIEEADLNDPALSSILKEILDNNFKLKIPFFGADNIYFSWEIKHSPIWITSNHPVADNALLRRINHMEIKETSNDFRQKIAWITFDFQVKNLENLDLSEEQKEKIISNVTHQLPYIFEEGKQDPGPAIMESVIVYSFLAEISKVLSPLNNIESPAKSDDKQIIEKYYSLHRPEKKSNKPLNRNLSSTQQFTDTPSIKTTNAQVNQKIPQNNSDSFSVASLPIQSKNDQAFASSPIEQGQRLLRHFKGFEQLTSRHHPLPKIQREHLDRMQQIMQQKQAEKKYETQLLKIWDRDDPIAFAKLLENPAVDPNLHIAHFSDLSLNNASLLHHAVADDDPSAFEFIKILLAHSKIKLEKNSEGLDPLHFAILKNNFKACELFMDAYIINPRLIENPNNKNSIENTYLQLAVKIFNPRIMKLLLETFEKTENDGSFKNQPKTLSEPTVAEGLGVG